MWQSLFLILALIEFSYSAPNPPPGSLVVGNGGQFRTIQQAVDAAQPGKTIFIQPGSYNEQVFVQKNNITIIGSSSSNSYSSNRVTITNSLAQDRGLNNDQTGTLRAHGSNFRLYNVNVVNTRGRGSQALALSAYGDKQAYYGCQFRGYQDTVLSERGHHLFSNSYIEGATDFIFGAHAQSWFDKCDIRATDRGFITANGRDSASNPSYFVLNRCNIDGNGSGTTYLGRPWRAFARVVVQNSRLGAVVNPAGWSIWTRGDERTANAQFAEYGNSGPGASGKRAEFSKRLNAPVAIESVLPGYGSWVDRTWPL